MKCKESVWLAHKECLSITNPILVLARKPKSLLTANVLVHLRPLSTMWTKFASLATFLAILIILVYNVKTASLDSNLISIPNLASHSNAKETSNMII